MENRRCEIWTLYGANRKPPLILVGHAHIKLAKIFIWQSDKIIVLILLPNQ